MDDWYRIFYVGSCVQHVYVCYKQDVELLYRKYFKKQSVN